MTLFLYIHKLASLCMWKALSSDFNLEREENNVCCGSQLWRVESALSSQEYLLRHDFEDLALIMYSYEV